MPKFSQLFTQIKSNKSTKYDISKTSAPKMPTLGKWTECIQILLSQASKDMHEPLVPMLFHVLGAHMSGSEFQYPDLTWKEICGQMAYLMPESGGNKGQLFNSAEAIQAVLQVFLQSNVPCLKSQSQLK